MEIITKADNKKKYSKSNFTETNLHQESIQLNLNTLFEDDISDSFSKNHHTSSSLIDKKTPLDNWVEEFLIKDYSTFKVRKSLNSIYESNFDKQSLIDGKVEESKKALKRKIYKMLKEEQVFTGYTSLIEFHFEELLKYKPLKFKEILNEIFIEEFDKPEILSKLIEVVSNFDYEVLYPFNITMVIGSLNHVDLRVVEASVAAIEKWENKNHAVILKNISFPSPWMEKYISEVISYLESCD